MNNKKWTKLVRVLAVPISFWIVLTIGTFVVQAEEVNGEANDFPIIEQDLSDDEVDITDSAQEESNEFENNLNDSTNNDQNEEVNENDSTLLNETEKKEDISYSTHVQDYGWQSEKSNGETSGTSGESKRLEAISIQLDNQSDYAGDITYQTHV